MFQTEVNLLLQSLGGPFWDALWWGVSELGRSPAYMALLILVSFGVDLRRGWWLGAALLWTGGLTEWAKELVALPRPVDVDSRVVYPPDGRATQGDFTARGARAFLAPLPEDVVEHYRARGAFDWGLPSGHTASFTTCVGGLSLLFLRRRVWLAACGAALVMGLSRLYLGRHFLADVLAGAALGMAVVAALRLAVAFDWRRAAWLRAAGLFAAPIVLLPLAFGPSGKLYAAQLWAWNLAFWLLERRGRDYSGGGPGQRAGRVAVALLVGGGMHLATRWAASATPWAASPWIELLAAFLGVFGLVVLGTLAAERLGLYPGGVESAETRT